MKTYSQKTLVASEADHIALAIERLVSGSGVSQAPVDLYAVANKARVHTLKCRRMLSDGLIRPDHRGFTVLLNGDRDTEIDIVNDPRPELSIRQRFTLAHELAHTCFFDFSVSPPRENVPMECRAVIETLCQFGAGMILIPEQLLRKELDGDNTISSLQTIRGIADRFQTSIEVLLRRIDRLEGFKATDNMFLYCGREPMRADIVIKACSYSYSLVNVVSKPDLFSSFGEWCQRNLRSDVSVGNSGSTILSRGGGKLRIDKKPQNLSGDFLVGIRLEI